MFVCLFFRIKANVSWERLMHMLRNAPAALKKKKKERKMAKCTAEVFQLKLVSIFEGANNLFGHLQ